MIENVLFYELNCCYFEWKVIDIVCCGRIKFKVNSFY